jgi:tetratricopeptide (TPR) repeat protein
MITQQNSFQYISVMHSKVNEDRSLSLKQKQEQIKVLKDADFWFSKGATTQYQGNVSASIDCYKQAVTINKGHYPTLFNLAICYESIAKFGCSLRCYRVASEIAPNLNEAFIGACLVAIKTNDL